MMMKYDLTLFPKQMAKHLLRSKLCNGKSKNENLPFMVTPAKILPKANIQLRICINRKSEDYFSLIVTIHKTNFSNNKKENNPMLSTTWEFSCR